MTKKNALAGHPGFSSHFSISSHEVQPLQFITGGADSG